LYVIGGQAWFICLRVQTPNGLVFFWGGCCPTDLKPAAVCSGVCSRVSRVCKRPTGHAVCRRFGSNNWYWGLGRSSAFLDKSRLTMCEGEIVGNSPTLCVVGGQTWFISLRVQSPTVLAYFGGGECWPNKPKTRCCAFECVCRDPTAWVCVGVCRVCRWSAVRFQHRRYIKILLCTGL
jgi:hypothetical protein